MNPSHILATMHIFLDPSLESIDSLVILKKFTRVGNPISFWVLVAFIYLLTRVNDLQCSLIPNFNNLIGSADNSPPPPSPQSPQLKMKTQLARISY